MGNKIYNHIDTIIYGPEISIWFYKTLSEQTMLEKAKDFRNTYDKNIKLITISAQSFRDWLKMTEELDIRAVGINLTVIDINESDCYFSYPGVIAKFEIDFSLPPGVIVFS